jgi:hypothetical protein
MCADGMRRETTSVIAPTSLVPNQISVLKLAKSGELWRRDHHKIVYSTCGEEQANTPRPNSSS